MKGRGYGRILNLTSIMAHISLPERTAYSATKAALLGLTRSLALELAREQITVVGISPGPCSTEMNKPLIENPEINAQFLSRIPVGRWGKVEEVGALARFLCVPRRRRSSRAATSSLMGAGVRSRLLAAVLLASLALAVTGCNRSRKKTIAVVPKGTAHLFWVSVHAGALAAAQEFNVDILWNGPAQETDYDRQVQIVDSVVAQHVDGIAMAANERQALVPPVDRAMKAGIPVAIVDSGLDSTNYTTFVATNNYEAGQMAARTLADLIGGSGDVAMLALAPGSGSTMDREKGFTDVIAKSSRGSGSWPRSSACPTVPRVRAAAENILTAQPRLAGFFASAEPSSIGVSLALKGRGLAGKVKYVAFDTADSLVQDLRDGTVDALLVQDPFHMGYEAVKAIVGQWNGKAPPPRIDLHAQVVRRGDLEKPEVKSLLAPDIGKWMH